ncbi:LuxR family transcriptional regulator [Nonomuraea deserti]|uniref:LuxR family transcriptional regulator n=1 Tax=Nonomuraea deserti TaxID=1848322 RepID=A0A4R4VB35_9ACTN|nr:LuxR family transcriptional regulator [Nonomuraea deserti]TDD01971.1 LuxR family transcriptional regulator [Nonomuraea deserti]
MAGRWQAGNLPAEPTSFVGRRQELDRVRRACARSRLVTLTGAGGVGKSRLALRAAAELRPGFSGGAWLVELSPLDDGTLLPHAIAEALKLADHTSRPMAEVLAEHLAGREVLLVLDTCEHLVTACAATVETLLAAVPGLRVLATGRRPLRMPGELVLVVDPLPVPGDGADAGGPVGGDAVALLAERAAEVVPGFDLADHDQAAVIRLCRRLEGIPLAIELAAARLRELPVEELADRLDDRFAALGDTPSDEEVDDRSAALGDAPSERASGLPAHADPPWHHDLRTAVGWSHELCEPAERLLWARLSVFAGDFGADAARVVCADDRLPESHIGLLLDALSEESILTWLPTGAGERYRMLDTLREYGAGRLRALGEEERFKQRHRAHYLSLAGRGAAGWLGPGQISWYDRMIGEHDNLRAALDTSLAGDDGRPALELAGMLAFFWYGCGHAKEGRHYLAQALAMAAPSDRSAARPPAADTPPGPAKPPVPDGSAHVWSSVVHGPPDPVLVQALWADGLLACTQGDADGCATRAAQCEAAAKAGDAYAATCARALRAAVAVIRGDAAGALAASRHAHETRWKEDAFTLPNLLALLCRAHAQTVDGRVDGAIAVLDDVRQLCDQRGERSMRSHVDFMRGRVELTRGRLGAAVSYGQAALRTKQRLHDRFGIGMTVDLLASAAGAAGQAERAARLLGLAQRIWSTHGRAQASVPAWVATRKACERRAQEALGPAAYRLAFATGHDSDVDAGIAYALQPQGEGLHNGGPPA